MRTNTSSFSNLSSDIVVGYNFLNSSEFLSLFINRYNLINKKLLIITDTNIEILYLENYIESLSRILEISNISKYAFKSCEENKNINLVQEILDFMFLNNLDRSSVVIAFGGGIVTDVAGFCASIFMRGIDWFSIPTTVIGQVDAAVGGKTGINNQYGKNLVGAFYKPKEVFIELSFINSLPEREYLSGLSEIVKYGLAFDNDFFNYLMNNTKRILDRDIDLLELVVKKCLSIKSAIVVKDERDKGQRQLLNLGHTFAHALEVATDYRRYMHGEAVAIGLVMAANLSSKLSKITSQEYQNIRNFIQDLNLPTKFCNLNSQTILKYMKGDKKNTFGEINLVLLEAVGKASMVNNLDESLIQGIIEDHGKRANKT